MAATCTVHTNSDTSQEASSKEWLSVCGSPNSQLAAELERKVEEKIAAGRYRRSDVEYIKRIDRTLTKTLNVNEVKLEKLRRLCQLWELELKSSEISSHRKFVGPIIVAAKKLLLPIMRVLLKDTLRQQRDFNAAAISLLTELCQEPSRVRDAGENTKA